MDGRVKQSLALTAVGALAMVASLAALFRGKGLMLAHQAQGGTDVLPAAYNMLVAAYICSGLGVVLMGLAGFLLIRPSRPSQSGR
jgi:hypothetical protein